MADTKRRSRGEDSIYFDHTGDCRDASSHRGCPGRWRGAVSGHDAAGKRYRSKVSGKTKTEVKDKLRELHIDLDVGVKTSAGYTVQNAVDDWMREGRDGVAARTISRDLSILKPVLAIIGNKSLRDLTTHDVRRALTVLAADHSTSTVTLVRNRLVMAIRHAEAGDHVRRNVAALVTPPAGTGGRPSKSLTVEQASAVLAAAEKSRLHAYIVVSLLTGARTEEVRALRWDHVDLDNGTMAVWRSVRQSGDTKTEKSRRTLALPRKCVDALTEHRKRQAEDRLRAGPLWQDNGLVFATSVGTAMNANNVIRGFRKVTKAAGAGEKWTPREMRHTFVSVMSDSGLPIEDIARLAGHSSTRTTEVVYRHELRPALTRGAEVMDKIFA
jgi:integrase